MHKILKIAILGMGGVGGFLGGKLAVRYENSEKAEIIFLARGAHLRKMAENGLKLITPHGELTARPALVTDQPNPINDTVDLLVCCVKSYDLEDSLKPFQKIIGNNTAILPFLNGVDATERIKRLFPETEVWEGCVYISARLTETGVVTVISEKHQFFFGAQQAATDKMRKIESMCKEAGLQTRYSEHITQTIWEKYFFIAAVATLTSYAHVTLGDILESKKYSLHMRDLLEELKAITDAKKISVPEDIVSKTMDKLKAFPPETTSSMASDFEKGSTTELDALTGYVVALGKNLQVPTPTFEKMFLALKGK